MSSIIFLHSQTRSLPKQSVFVNNIFTRSISNSPYGRTHVWKRRQKKLPNPIVPRFPQLVIRSDGSTFTHYTSSPKEVFKLSRDVTNHPLWNPRARNAETAAEEDEVTGRLGRFNRRFEGLGGSGEEVDWMGAEQEVEEENKNDTRPGKTKKQ